MLRGHTDSGWHGSGFADPCTGAHERGRRQARRGTRRSRRGSRRGGGVWYAVSVKPHPKIRKTVKWGGAVVTVVLVVVWIGSGWVYLTWGGPAGSIEVRGRTLAYFDNGTLFAPSNPPLSRGMYAISSGPKTFAWGTNPHRMAEHWLPQKQIYVRAVGDGVNAITRSGKRLNVPPATRPIHQYRRCSTD